MAVAGSHGLPVSLCIESASPQEVKLVHSTLVEMVIPEAPPNLVGDNAYDSDKLDAELKQYGIEVIARTAAIARTRLKTGVVCADTADAGKARGCSLGFRTFGYLLCATSAMLRNFLRMLHLRCCAILLRRL